MNNQMLYYFAKWKKLSLFIVFSSKVKKTKTNKKNPNEFIVSQNRMNHTQTCVPWD